MSSPGDPHDTRERRVVRDLAGAAVRAYVVWARTVPRLTAERERDLARRAAHEDTAAVGQLVCAHLRLVISLAQSFVGRGLPLEDLIQEGTVGLLAAVRHFDWRRDKRLAGYAVHRIRGAISDAVTAREAADAPITNIDPNALADVTGDDAALDPCAVVVAREAVSEIRCALDELLTPRERTIIRQRFGFDGEDRESLGRVGEGLGVRRDGVRRIEVGAVAKLRRELVRRASQPPERRRGGRSGAARHHVQSRAAQVARATGTDQSATPCVPAGEFEATIYRVPVNDLARVIRSWNPGELGEALAGTSPEAQARIYEAIRHHAEQRILVARQTLARVSGEGAGARRSGWGRRQEHASANADRGPH